MIEDETEFQIMKLTPYIWKNEDEVLYGWHRDNQVYNNKINGVHEGCDFYQNVIGFASLTVDIESKFIKSTFDKFPITECTEYNEKEKIYTSQNLYTCLVIDNRFNDEYQVLDMSPYIVREDKNIYLAWMNNERDFIDNFENSVHGDCWDEYVIGFVKKAE